MPVFLAPSTVSALTAECKALLSNLSVEIVDEDLCPESSGSTTYVGRYDYWLAYPVPKIRKIGTDGVETLLFVGTDYTLDLAAGQIVLGSAPAAGEVIRADYFYAPLNDTILERLLSIAVKEIEVLIHRSIDDTNILRDYKAAVCKRLYTNVLKNLLIEARNFFSFSAGGRSLSKGEIVGHLSSMVRENEDELILEIRQLRDWNKTERFS